MERQRAKDGLSYGPKDDTGIHPGKANPCKAEPTAQESADGIAFLEGQIANYKAATGPHAQAAVGGHQYSTQLSTQVLRRVTRAPMVVVAFATSQEL